MTFNTHNTASRQRRLDIGRGEADFAVAVWTMKKNKQQIMLRDMGDDHLTRTIEMLIRRAGQLRSNDDLSMLSCPEPNGEMAQMAFQEECALQSKKTLEEYLPDIYWDMVHEYRHRGLSTKHLDDYNSLVHAASTMNTLHKLRASK